MSVAVYMRWPNIDVDASERIRDHVRWEENLPEGALFHVASPDGDALRVFDIWESAEQFDTFVQSRILPALQELGIETDPEVYPCEVHRMFAPKGIESGAGVLVYPRRRSLEVSRCIPAATRSGRDPRAGNTPSWRPTSIAS